MMILSDHVSNYWLFRKKTLPHSQILQQVSRITLTQFFCRRLAPLH